MERHRGRAGADPWAALRARASAAKDCGVFVCPKRRVMCSLTQHVTRSDTSVFSGVTRSVIALGLMRCRNVTLHQGVPRLNRNQLRGFFVRYDLYESCKRGRWEGA